MTRKWCIMDLIIDHQSGKLRETAVWSNIGKATMTGAFINQAAHGTLTEWYVFAYGALVIAHETVARLQNQRQQELDAKGVKP